MKRIGCYFENKIQAISWSINYNLPMQLVIHGKIQLVLWCLILDPCHGSQVSLQALVDYNLCSKKSYTGLFILTTVVDDYYLYATVQLQLNTAIIITTTTITKSA